MINRTCRILHGIRDIPLIVFSVVIMSTSYGKWVEEPVHYVLFCIAVGFGLLSLVDLMFVLRRRGKRFHFVNAYFQLLPSFIIAGLLPIAGVPLLILNILIIITLRSSKPHST